MISVQEGDFSHSSIVDGRISVDFLQCHRIMNLDFYVWAYLSRSDF